MTVKALKKQLMAAIAMVVVSAIALSSSTYAWFVTNSTVTADGMKVQATAENGIEIQNAITHSTWASSASGNHSTSVKLVPTSTVDATAWFHASALAKDSSTVDTTTIEQLTLAAETDTAYVGKISADDESGYYIHNQFAIRATNSAATNLKISEITVGETTDELSAGLRILIKCGDNTWIYAPLSTDVEEDQNPHLTYNVGTARTEVIALETTAANFNAEDNKLAASVNTAGVTVDVYVYFEGEDGVIYTDNIPETLQNLSVTIDFTATI